MNTERFTQHLNALEHTLQAQLPGEDIYARLDALTALCEYDTIFRQRVEIYCRFLLKDLEIRSAHMGNEDMIEEVVLFLFIAVIVGIHRSGKRFTEAGELVPVPKRHHWLPVVLMKQFAPGSSFSPPKKKTRGNGVRARLTCFVVRGSFSFETHVNDTAFIHNTPSYYEDRLEHTFGFSEDSYGYFVDGNVPPDNMSDPMKRITFAVFSLLCAVRFPLKGGSFRAGDLPTTLSSLLSWMDGMGAMYVNISKTNVQLPLSVLSSPYIYTDHEGNTMFFFPLALKTGMLLTTKPLSAPENVSYWFKKFRMRIFARAFEKNEMVFGVENVGQYQEILNQRGKNAGNL